DLFADQGTLDEHREQGGGHAVADGIDDAERDAGFVEAGDVVEVAADVAGGAEQDVEVGSAHLRQGAGQEVLLEAGGEAQLVVQPQHVKLERLIMAAELDDLSLERVDLLLKRIKAGLGAVKIIQGEREG